LEAANNLGWPVPLLGLWRIRYKRRNYKGVNEKGESIPWGAVVIIPYVCRNAANPQSAKISCSLSVIKFRIENGGVAITGGCLQIGVGRRLCNLAWPDGRGYLEWQRRLSSLTLRECSHISDLLDTAWISLIVVKRERMNVGNKDQFSLGKRCSICGGPVLNSAKVPHARNVEQSKPRAKGK